MTFDGANKYCEESIEKLQQLAHYVKERRKIEEENIGKLCKSVSLKPFKKDDWFEESDKSSVSRTTLWRTFYEIIDDTAQISKSHDAFADSLKNQLFEPLSAAVKQQKADRQEVQAAAEELVKRVNEAKSLVKKTFSKYEDAFEKHADHQATGERYNATGRIKDYDKQLTKVRAAQQKLDDAAEKHEDAKAGLEKLRLTVERTESPRLMARMRELESARMKGALGCLLELIELERRCAAMDERYASEMVAKLRQIDLHADDQHFSRTHIESSGISTGALMNLSKPIPTTTTTTIATPNLKQIEQPPRYHEPAALVELYPGYATDGTACPSQPPAYSLENLEDPGEEGEGAGPMTRSVSGGLLSQHSKSVASMTVVPLSCSVGQL